jgi:hypothetical protein
MVQMAYRGVLPKVKPWIFLENGQLGYLSLRAA